MSLSIRSATCLILPFSLTLALGQGDLTPPGPPGQTMKSLQEIWDRIGVLETANAAQAQLITAQTSLLNALAESQGLLGWRVSTFPRALIPQRGLGASLRTSARRKPKT